MTANVGVAIESAAQAAGLSQRGLADRTGISQPTLNRIMAGSRPAKMTEIMLIADATGYTVAQLCGSAVEGRVQFASRATNGSGMDIMRQRLLHFIELDAYLEDQAIPAAQ